MGLVNEFLIIIKSRLESSKIITYQLVVNFQTNSTSYPRKNDSRTRLIITIKTFIEKKRTPRVGIQLRSLE